MKKSVYKSAMSHVRSSEDFKEATYRKLMQEMQKTTKIESSTQKERLQMEKSKNKKLTGWAVGIAACAVLTVGLLNMSPNSPTTTSQPSPVATQPSPDITQPSPNVTQRPTTGKAAVNIDGVISEVSADGKSFKVGELWVTVTPETQLGIDGPTAAKPSEELLQKEFKVGNIVSGFTTEDIATGQVNATRIYNNIAPQQ